MWKFIARGIQETFERRICRTNIYSQSSQDNAKNEMKVNLVRQQKFLPPVLATCDKSFCGSARSADTGDKEHNSKWNAKHNWTEAVGWSSALAAGWVVCQTLCLHKRFLDRDNKISVETLKDKLFNCTGISQLLMQLSNLQPIHIFPVTNCIGNNNKKSKSELESNDQWTAEKPFDPITIEEEFETIANEFANINKIIIGRYELHCGIKALGKKRYKDALMHFIAGAKMSSPRSMFNLGLCYELGIGTIMDQSKAIEHYNNAARYDHADALYNLGVYHAQGRGGLPINIDTARNYFIKAAKLGQMQAKHALDLEKAEKLTKTNNIVPNTN